MVRGVANLIEAEVVEGYGQNFSKIVVIFSSMIFPSNTSPSPELPGISHGQLGLPEGNWNILQCVETWEGNPDPWHGHASIEADQFLHALLAWLMTHVNMPYVHNYCYVYCVVYMHICTTMYIYQILILTSHDILIFSWLHRPPTYPSQASTAARSTLAGLVAVLRKSIAALPLKTG